MVWGGFWQDGKTELVFLEGVQDSIDYTGIIGDHMLPFAHSRFGHDLIFQQDNASIHLSNVTKEWFADAGINVMDWPSLSPDLNPIENVWGYLVQQVYGGCKQYSSKGELKNAILQAWSSLPQTYLKTLVDSIKKRCIEVIKSRGHTIKY